MGHRGSLVFAAVLLWVSSAGAQTDGAPVARMYWSPTVLSWQPEIPDYAIVMTIEGPAGYRRQRSYPVGEAPMVETYDETGEPLAEGEYRYTLQVLFKLDDIADQELAVARENSDQQSIEILYQLGRVPRKPKIQTGTFAIQAAQFTNPGESRTE